MARGGGGAGPGPACCACLRGGLSEDRPTRLPGPYHGRPHRDLVKGLALFSFAPLLLRRPPFTLSSVRRSCFSARQSEPGALEVPAVGVLFLSPFVRGGRATRSQPPGPGAGPRPSFLFPAAAPGPEGPGVGPTISQAGPRGMCRFILLWRTGGPEIRPFLLFVFYFETVFNAFI